MTYETLLEHYRVQVGRRLEVELQTIHRSLGVQDAAKERTLAVMRRVQGWPQARDGHWVPHLISLLR